MIQSKLADFCNLINVLSFPYFYLCDLVHLSQLLNLLDFIDIQRLLKYHDTFPNRSNFCPLLQVEKGQLMSCNPRERSRREGAEEEGGTEDKEDDTKERTEGLEDGIDTGDSWNVPVICNNLERALFLSLHYQFVTPLTSLVVIKPDTVEKGDIAEVSIKILVF